MEFFVSNHSALDVLMSYPINIQPNQSTNQSASQTDLDLESAFNLIMKMEVALISIGFLANILTCANAIRRRGKVEIHLTSSLLSLIFSCFWANMFSLLLTVGSLLSPEECISKYLPSQCYSQFAFMLTLLLFPINSYLRVIRNSHFVNKLSYCIPVGCAPSIVSALTVTIVNGASGFTYIGQRNCSLDQDLRPRMERVYLPQIVFLELLSLLVFLLLYGLILRTLKLSRKMVVRHNPRAFAQQPSSVLNLADRKHLQFVKHFAATSLVLFLCRTPGILIIILKNFQHIDTLMTPLMGNHGYLHFFIISSCLNNLVYIAFDREFRTDLRNMLLCLR